MEFTIIQKLFIWAIPILFAITVHEVAHGWVASKCGDQTAKMLGRITLNPLKHIDVLGTIVVPLVLFFLGGFIFGWAKPVPVNWNNLKSPRRDMALVAIAGPMANLIMAIAWAFIAKVGIWTSASSPWVGAILYNMGFAGISINLILCILNLIPIPPLDGSRVVTSFLSPKAALHYNSLERYGFIILVLLLATGILAKIMMPFFKVLLMLMVSLFGLNVM